MAKGKGVGGYVLFFAFATLILLVLVLMTSVLLVYTSNSDTQSIPFLPTTTTSSPTTSATTTTRTTTTTTTTGPTTTPATPHIQPLINRIYQSAPNVIGMNINQTQSNVPVYVQAKLINLNLFVPTQLSDNTPTPTLLAPILTQPLLFSNAIPPHTNDLAALAHEAFFALNIMLSTVSGSPVVSASYVCYSLSNGNWSSVVVYPDNLAALIHPFNTCMEEIAFGYYAGTGISGSINQCPYCYFFTRNCVDPPIQRSDCAANYFLFKK